MLLHPAGLAHNPPARWRINIWPVHGGILVPYEWRHFLPWYVLGKQNNGVPAPHHIRRWFVIFPSTPGAITTLWL